jgi:nicotinate-nucleotide adenylyltransferase
MAIALFGGSFDPPHSGHLGVIHEALKSLPIEKLIIVPAYVNPFKKGTHASATLRLKWLQTIFEGNEKVEVSDFEILKGCPVRTIETVRHYLKKDPDIYLIIGADNLEDLSKWHRFDELDSLVTWVIAKRDQQKIDTRYLTLDVNEPISSSRLRQSIEYEKLPKKVADEIALYYKETYAKTH